MRKKTARHRLLSAFLSLCMLMSLFNGIAPFAETSGDIGEPELDGSYVGDTLCDHTHDDACGYVEASDGTPCNHTHNDICGYVEASDGTPCNHTHDDACGYTEGTEGTPCDKACTDTDDDGRIDHGEDCAYAPASNGTPCGHIHDGGCGYIAPTEGQACQHVHDDACGYKEAVEGSPCTYVCETGNMGADTDRDKNLNEEPSEESGEESTEESTEEATGDATEESTEEATEDPDALLDSDLTINGKAVGAEYAWQDESGLMSVNVTFEGEIFFDGELPEEPVLALKVDINVDEEQQISLPTIENQKYQPVMALGLHLTVGDQELDLSGVSAQVELNVAKKALSLLLTMALEEDESITDLAVVQGEKILDSVSYEMPELTQTENDSQEENDTLNFRLERANEKVMLLAAVRSFSNNASFTVNGQAVDDKYTWQDESGLMSMNVTFEGEILFDGELPEEPVLTLNVDIDIDEEPEYPLSTAEGEEYLYIMTLGLHLSMEGKELDLSGVSARAALNVAKKMMILPQTMSLEKDGDLEEDVLLTTDLVVVQGDKMLDSAPYELLDMLETAALTADPEDDSGDGSGENTDEKENYEFNLDLEAPNQEIMLFAAVSNFSYDPNFTIQHYFWFPHVQSEYSSNGGRAENRIPFINTNQGGLGFNGNPAQGVSVNNGSNNPSGMGFLIVDVDTGKYNHLTTNLVLKQLFVDEDTSYQENPQINFMSRLYNGEGEFNPNYTLSQIWVYQPDYATNTAGGPEDITNYIIYDVPWADGSTTVHAPERIRFTNNPSNTHLTIRPTRDSDNNTWETTVDTIQAAAAEFESVQLDGSEPPVNVRRVTAGSGAGENYPYDYTVLIQEGTVIRLIFDVSEANYSASATFFDYNITDGYIYTAAIADEDHRYPTTDQNVNEPRTLYAYTYRQGINDPANYTGDGTQFAFGNANTGSGLDNLDWKGNFLNKRNVGTYFGLTFGLVQNIRADGTITWADGVTGPDVFTTEETTGKFCYNGQMTFFRQGGTYTLDAVSGDFGSKDNLRALPVTYNQGGIVINSNEFWPMDGVMGNSELGHDLAFGNDKNTQHFGYGDTKELPLSDTPGYHNSYFGMSYSINFTLDPGYVAPLEYWFYGDDDLWVFLSERDANGNLSNSKLVADIGGVHQSAGMMVNLWDYIEPVPINEESSKSYTLSVYYTERGASGSTCYMRFSVPLDSVTSQYVQPEAALIVEKVLMDENDHVADYGAPSERYGDLPDLSGYGQGDPDVMEWLNTMKKSGYFIFRLRLYEGNLPMEDIFHYEIHPAYTDNTRTMRTDHKTAEPLEEGDIGLASEVSGDYYFALRGGEYIAVTGLPSNTRYSVQELTGAEYSTRYQVGEHNHVGNTQVDTLKGDYQFGDLAGDDNRLAVKNENYVVFYNGSPLKAEIDPGEGKAVNIGDVITYEIDWSNDPSGEADVIIADELDPGVDFVAAKFGDSRENKILIPTADYSYQNGDAKYTSAHGNTIEYDPDTHTVTWTRFEQGDGGQGSVSLQVRVNENTKIGWGYDESADGAQSGDDDFQVVNRAKVQIGNKAYVTNMSRNPVRDPYKTELAPGDGVTVGIGQEINYAIDWQNYQNDAETVTIVDPLDKGVDFVSAIFTSSIRLEAGSTTAAGTVSYREENSETIENIPVTIRYDTAGHTVTWTIGDEIAKVPAHAAGRVELIVKTNENAKQYWNYPDIADHGADPDNLVRNRASVQVGNDAEQFTKVVTNPVGYGSLTVSKTVTGTAGDQSRAFHFTVTLSDDSINGTFGDVTVVNGAVSFTLNHGESKTIRALPAGIAYTVTENDANEDGYTTTSTGESGTITKGGNSEALFVNHKDLRDGNLTVTKMVTGTAGDTSREFHFTVTLSDGSSIDFSLRHGESKTITDLPEGIGYTVTEAEANQDGYTTTSTGESGTIIKDGNSEALFVNHKDLGYGSLTVSKTVTGTAGDQSRAFHFTVTLSDDSINGTFGDVTVVNGAVSFTLNHGESKTIRALPAGIAYTVTENDANEDGYTTTSTGESGTIINGEASQAQFENHKDLGYGSLTVSKTVTGTAGDPNREFHFTVTLSDGSSIDFSLRHGESKTISDLLEGTTYTVTEAEANQDGYTTTSTGESGTIIKDGNSEALFVNHKDLGYGSLTVSKTVTGTAGDTSREFYFTVTLSDGNINETFGDVAFVNGETSFTLRHGESKTITDLLEGTTYTVTEAEANEDGYTTTSTGESGTIINGEASQAQFENHKDLGYGSLTVSKTVTGTAGDPNREFHFTVTLSNGSKIDFTLRHGESKTISDLLEGTTYTVTEAEANEDGYTTTSTGESGTITNGGNSEALFINHKDLGQGNLTVTKMVTGTAGDRSQAFHFTVTLSDGTVNGTFGDVAFVNGAASFTLSHGESKTISDLLEGTTYTVTEAEANEDGYTTTSSGENGTITDGGNSEALFVNHKDLGYGSLTVSKTITGTAGDPNREFHFTVTLSDGSSIDFTLRHGESKTISDLLEGTDYTVTEAEANEDGYTTTSSGENGTITDGVNNEALFVNHKDLGQGNLTVTKMVTGTAGDQSREFHFTVTLSDGSSIDFTLRHGESKTISDLLEGTAYTVTEAEANQDGYTTTSTGESGTITNGGNSEALFVNHKADKPPDLGKGNLTVSKTVTGTAGDTSREFHFTVTLSDGSINGTFGDVAFVNGATSFTLRHGESKTISDLPEGAAYTVTEAEANQDGYTTSSTGESGTIAKGGNSEVLFENHKDLGYGSLTVSKTVTGTAGDLNREFHFTVTLSDGSSIDFSLRHGESKTITDLLEGTTYTVTEAEANQDGYTTTSTGESGTITNGVNSQAQFVNHRDLGYGSLTVSKTVTGTAGDPNREFHFTVTLSDGSSIDFSLRHGESKTITDLLEGTTYTVTEVEANEDGYTTISTGESGTITNGGNSEALFVNHKADKPPDLGKGNLTVSKTVTGTAGDRSQMFHFTVTLSDSSINGTFSDVTFVNGAASFTLSHGESKTIRDLPEGIGYTVTEAEANEDGYTTTSTGESGTITKGGNSEALFVNHKDLGQGNLTVTKMVTGTAGDRSRAFHFTVTLSNGSSIDFSLRHGESKTISDLLEGTTYTVTEAEANQDGYTTSSTGESGTITNGGNSQALFVNHKDLGYGSLTVSKTVTGTAGDPNREFHFTMTLSNGSKIDFTLRHGESKTISDLLEGTDYTVTEAEANQDGYTTTSTGESGTITDGGNSQAQFENHKDLGYGSLTVSKTVTGTAGDPNREFHFTVTLSDGNSIDFTLRHGESKTISDLLEGTDYTVTEAEANQDGYTTTSTGESGTITNGEASQAQFENHKDLGYGSLTVSKTVTGTAGDPNREFHFTVTLSDGSSIDFSLRHGESKMICDLPEGITYTVTEAEADEDGYTTTSTGENGTITDGGNSEALFVNHKDLGHGDLTVTKMVTGTAGDQNREFHFTVTLSDGSSIDFTLRHGESKTISDLLEGTTYTVTEAEADEDGYTTTSTGESGTITDGGNSEALFVNHKDLGHGDLTVSKTVTGTAGDLNREFHFTVTLSDRSINDTFGDVTFVNGEASFTLRHGESKTIRALPAGIAYTVMENDANEDGYTTTSTGESGIIINGEASQAQFVNHKDLGYGSLTVSKTVTGTAGDPNREFHFTVTLSDGSSIDFTLRHGESKTIINLPEGIGYTVTEAEANQDGYTTTSTGESGTITDGGNSEALFINHKAAKPGKPSDTPDTGDNFNLERWMAMMLMSVIGLLGVGIFSNKKQKSRVSKRNQ